MNARIRPTRGEGADRASVLAAPPTALMRWLDERLLPRITFRLRLLGMAFQRQERIPAMVLMALESCDYEVGELLDPDPQAADSHSVR